MVRILFHEGEEAIYTAKHVIIPVREHNLIIIDLSEMKNKETDIVPENFFHRVMEQPFAKVGSAVAFPSTHPAAYPWSEAHTQKHPVSALFAQLPAFPWDFRQVLVRTCHYPIEN